MIVSNDNSKINLIAADALSQLEHDEASRAFVLSSNLDLLKRVKKEIKVQIERLARQSILQKSINNLLLIKVKSYKDCISLVNDCAPEHLILLDLF